MNGRLVAGTVSVGLALTLLPLDHGRAQGRDGKYAGTIGCDALPALRALKTTVTMTVAGIGPSTSGRS